MFDQTDLVLSGRNDVTTQGCDFDAIGRLGRRHERNVFRSFISVRRVVLGGFLAVRIVNANHNVDAALFDNQLHVGVFVGEYLVTVRLACTDGALDR